MKRTIIIPIVLIVLFGSCNKHSEKYEMVKKDIMDYAEENAECHRSWKIQSIEFDTILDKDIYAKMLSITDLPSAECFMNRNEILSVLQIKASTDTSECRTVVCATTLVKVRLRPDFEPVLKKYYSMYRNGVHTGVYENKNIGIMETITDDEFTIMITLAESRQRLKMLYYSQDALYNLFPKKN